MKSAIEALEQLKAGNKRFVADASEHSNRLTAECREKQVGGQSPWAIILGCSDSRAPVEMIFDQALGDLFVVRLAGNVASKEGLGSIEFAVQSWGMPLIVVLGHSNCGAVNATINLLQHPGDQPSDNLNSVVSKIVPAVQPLIGSDVASDSEALADSAIRKNVEYSVTQMTERSSVLKALVDQGALTVVGAQYSLETGSVEFFQ